MGGRGSGGGRSGGGGGAAKSLSDRVKEVSQKVVTGKEFENNYLFYKNLNDAELVEAVKIARRNFNRVNNKFNKLEQTGISHGNLKLQELSAKASNLNNSLKNGEMVLKNRGIKTDWTHSPYGGWHIDNVAKGGGVQIRKNKDNTFKILAYDSNGKVTHSASASTLTKAKKYVKSNLGIGTVNNKKK